MSWNYSAMAKDKEKLKADCRSSLLPAYSKPGSVHHTAMTKVMAVIDATIDMFDLRPGQLIKLETQGHIEGGAGNMKLDVSNAGHTFID